MTFCYQQALTLNHDFLSAFFFSAILVFVLKVLNCDFQQFVGHLLVLNNTPDVVIIQIEFNSAKLVGVGMRLLVSNKTPSITVKGFKG